MSNISDMSDMSEVSLDWLDYSKIVEIVEIASQIILQIYLNDELFMNMNMAIENKVDAGNSTLTIADKKANDFICRELRGLYPDIPIISEENKNDDWEVRRKYKWVWLVDPLDGTKDFIKRNGEFTVNIGLAYGGQPVAGFVGIPAQGLVYWGSEEGNGAWKKKIGEYNSAKYVDLLEEDKAIAGQKYVCISFVSPEKILKQKDIFDGLNVELNSNTFELCSNVGLNHPNHSSLSRFDFNVFIISLIA